MINWIDDRITLFLESEKEEMSFDINPSVLHQYLSYYPDGENRILTKLSIIQNSKGLKILCKRNPKTNELSQILVKKEISNNV